ncbi:MAG: hypothetical protein ABFS34_03395 [Gemmatimonadota bacterium]
MITAFVIGVALAIAFPGHHNAVDTIFDYGPPNIQQALKAYAVSLPTAAVCSGVMVWFRFPPVRWWFVAGIITLTEGAFWVGLLLRGIRDAPFAWFTAGLAPGIPLVVFAVSWMAQRSTLIATPAPLRSTETDPELNVVVTFILVLLWVAIILLA